MASPASQETNETGDVVRQLTHELRQPLSTIETAAYYLEMVLGKADERVFRQVEKIQQMVEQMNWMLSDAVHYLQASVPHPHQMDLAEIIGEILAGYESKEAATVSWSATSVAPLVYMDPSQALHLVRSVLVVFRQMADSEQPVLITLVPEGPSTVFTCACAVRAEVLDRSPELFAPFYSPHSSGSGLALAGVRRIVEVHGGVFRLSREGTRLTLEVRLPAN